MNRRDYLATFGAIGLSSVAGCTDGGSGDTETTNPPATTEPATEQTTKQPTAEATTEKTTEEPEPASFEIIDATIPNEVEINEEFKISFKIKNVGDEAGVFNRYVAFRKGYNEDGVHTDTADIQSNIPPNNTKTVEISSLSFRFTTTITIQIEEFEQKWTIEMLPRQLNIGETYLSAHYIKATVHGVEFTKEYEYEIEFTTYTDRADEGMKWALLDFEAEKSDGPSTNILPEIVKINLVGENDTYNYRTYRGEDEYEGGETEFYEDGRQGVIAYEVDDDFPEDEFKVHWDAYSEIGPYDVYWSK